VRAYTPGAQVRRTIDGVILVTLLTGEAMDDARLAQLATDLGLVAYEARMTVAAGYPAVLATMADASRAHDLVATLRAHGGDAVACDANEVVSSDAMVALDKFTLDAHAIRAGRQELVWGDVLCLLRASHRARSSTETKTTETKFSAGKSLLTGGLSNTTTVTKHAKESSESREQVLYVFRRSGQTPWVLREYSRYEGLGSALARTTIENFATTVRLLRERAPDAVYDERLVSRARVPERALRRGTAAQSTVTHSSASGVDVLAHLVALSIARSHGVLGQFSWR
jgi:hypothetical protein